MVEVFKILPARADDHQAYMSHQKAESEKRLLAKQKPPEPEKPQPQRKKMDTRLRSSSSPAVNNNIDSKTPRDNGCISDDNNENSYNKDKKNSLDDNTELETMKEEDDELLDEECTPERVMVIATVYNFSYYFLT